MMDESACKAVTPKSASGWGVNESSTIHIRCIVERLKGACADGCDKTADKDKDQVVVERDEHLTLMTSSCFHEIVRSSLLSLGYTESEILGARGSIELKNWKPITIDMVTDNLHATVKDIFDGVLLSHITLKIRLQSSINLAEDVKQKLLSFLVEHSQDLLANTGCPIQKINGAGESISSTVEATFNRWYKEQQQCGQQQEQQKQQQQQRQQQLQHQDAYQDTRISPQRSQSTTSKTDSTHSKPSSVRKSLVFSPTNPESPANQLLSGVEVTASGSVPIGSHINVRTWFDPDTELPMLQSWLAENRHPSKVQMLKYVDELNSKDYRRMHRPLDLSNLSYWFKNARARSIRAADSSTNKYTATKSLSSCSNGDSIKVGAGVVAKKENGDDLASSDDDAVPLLPNSNAVYVIKPLHSSMSNISLSNVKSVGRKQPDYSGYSSGDSNDGYPATRKSVSASSRQSQEESSKSDENHNKRQTLYASPDVQVEATDLSVRNRTSAKNVQDSTRPTSVNNARSVKTEWNFTGCRQASQEWDRPVKRRRSSANSDEFSASNSASSSPQPATVNGIISVPLHPHFSQLPFSHFPSAQMHALQQQQHSQALQMAAISHAMRFADPASSSLYAAPNASHFLFGGYNGGSANRSLPLALNDEGNNHDSSSGSVNGDDSRQKRSRVFIDPLSEIPKLEQWFLLDSHPSSFVIEQFTDELNRLAYRQRFPRLEAKNIQLWFKNHRAKVKRKQVERSLSSNGDSNGCATRDGENSLAAGYGEMKTIENDGYKTEGYSDRRTMYDTKLSGKWNGETPAW